MRRAFVAAMVTFFAFASIAAAAPKLTDVNPWTYNPFHGSLVESDWINHLGCPYNAAMRSQSVWSAVTARA